MFEYPRKDFRNTFLYPRRRNRLPVAGITIVRHIGPLWIIAGRRPRTIPVFVIKTTVLSARAAA